jgi:two-component system chemotaxis sensor kinase CheA
MREPIRDLTMLLRHLQREVFQARMLPFATIADRFPHMVRELGRSLHKEINFEVSGESIELDRGVLELIVEPLMHLLRNAVDHGLETPEERAAAGKPARSNLHLSIIRGADHVQIDVTDDGRGMNIPLILKKAVSQGLIDNQRASSMSKDELLMLVCVPGFSTKSSVTEVSGRGVGMDVVSHAIHTIGGTLSIASNQGEGTRITMRLPISISIIQALMVRCGKLSLAVPICNIQRTIEISSHQAVEKNGTLSFDLDGINIPLRRLSRIFRQESQEHLSGILSVIITEANGFPTGLLVDNIIRQQELFVRPLSTPLSSLKGVAGATTSGDGQILFVLDVAACAHPGISA